MGQKSINIIPFLVVIVIFFLIDLYVFKGLKVLLNDPQNGATRKWILASHWILSALIAAWFFVILYQVVTNPDFRNYKMTYYLFGIMLLVYIPKIVFSVFIFSEDLIWLGRNVVAFFTPGETKSSGESISRLRFIYQLGAGAAAIPFVGAAYGMLKGRFDFGVKTVKIVIPHLPESFEGLRMVQLSDLHLGSFFDDKSSVAPGLEMVRKLHPDVLVVTGDWVNNFSSEAETWIEEFKSLPAKIAKLTIVGNHDYGDYSQWNSAEEKQRNFDRLIEIHGEMGFTSLLNDHHIIERNGEKLAIIGVENWGVKPFPQHGDLAKAKQGTEGIPVKILLSHDPSHFGEIVTKDHLDIDLTLSGHTHGAQFGVELGNIKWSPVKYKYARWAGMYEVGKQRLYVNRGFGYIGFPGRVGMPPEITIFEFTRG